MATGTATNLAKVRNNAAGLDDGLYNEHTASEGWFFTKE